METGTRRFVNPVLLALIALTGMMGCDHPSESPAPLSSAAQSLNEERIETLQRLVEIVQVQYNEGRADYSEVLSAERNLLRARISQGADADRVGFREELVENLKLFEDTAKARFEAAIGSETDLLAARAARLQAEIELEMERNR